MHNIDDQRKLGGIFAFLVLNVILLIFVFVGVNHKFVGQWETILNMVEIYLLFELFVAILSGIFLVLYTVVFCLIGGGCDDEF